MAPRLSHSNFRRHPGKLVCFLNVPHLSFTGNYFWSGLGVLVVESLCQCVCMCVCISKRSCLWRPEEGSEFPEVGVTSSCESPDEFWEPNSGPLQEEFTLLGADPVFQPLSDSL